MKAVRDNSSMLASLAYVVVVIAGLKTGSSLVIPLLMAFFWFLLFLPLANKLRSFGLPDLITTIIVFGITLIIVIVLGTFLITSGQDLVANLPAYQEKFYELTPKITDFFERFGIPLQKNEAIDLFDPAKIIDYTAAFLKGMGNVMTNGFMTLLIVMFLFLESSLLSEKVFYLTKREDSKEKIRLFLHNINVYFLTKTATSAATGLLVWGMLAFFELDYALLFGVLAFFLNYIPSIGSYIAAFPALLMALLQLSLIETTIIAIGYIIINNLIGSFIEPKVMGKGVGLSTLVVFISMVFWGWMFGPVGMFLSVPLTVVIKIACDNSKELHWVSILLSSKVS
ncbi:MAG: AI-2E family transporter [Campylobacterota bacterium]|nr:AI-2E family transporter [Campylobacterota bacterium]